MILPPMLIDVRFRDAGGRARHIWVPLVILWPILAVFVVLALAFSVIVDAALLLAGRPYHHYTALLFAVGRLVAEVRGTVAYIADADQLVDVVIV